MLALLTLVAALEASPAPAASPAAPAAAASAAPAPAVTEDPAITKLAREQYDAFAAGKVDQSQYSAAVPQAAISQVQAGLTSIGAVKSVAFVKGSTLAGSMVYVYKFTCAKGAAYEQIAVKDGKIDGIYFVPAQ